MRSRPVTHAHEMQNNGAFLAFYVRETIVRARCVADLHANTQCRTLPALRKAITRARRAAELSRLCGNIMFADTAVSNNQRFKPRRGSWSKVSGYRRIAPSPLAKPAISTRRSSPDIPWSVFSSLLSLPSVLGAGGVHIGDRKAARFLLTWIHIW